MQLQDLFLLEADQKMMTPEVTCLSAMTPAAEHPMAITSQGKKESRAEDLKLTPRTLLK